MSTVCPDVVGKWSWPELVGVPGRTAVATIERENPTLTADIIPPGSFQPTVILCDRVRVVNAGGIVISVPNVG
ncbi:hypothetical protein ACS0TY_001402 [Phlomoides rotata]